MSYYRTKAYRLRHRPFTEAQLQAGRDKLAAAFKALRKMGFLARKNFLCCMGCASSQLYVNWDKMKEPRKSRTTAVVYYHRQDEETLVESGKLYLRYSALTDQEDKDELTKAAGKKVAAALKAEGLKIEWDGDPSNCILVHVAQV